MPKKFTDYLPYSWVPWESVQAWADLPNQKKGVFCRSCQQQVTREGCSCGHTPPSYLEDLMKDWA